MPVFALAPMAAAAFWGTAGAGIGAAANIYGANKQASASRRAMDAQSRFAQQAADAESRAAQEALAYQREQDAARKAEFEKTQMMNKEQYDLSVAMQQAQLDEEKRRYEAEQARRAPYREMSLAALGNIRNLPFQGGFAPGKSSLSALGGER